MRSFEVLSFLRHFQGEIHIFVCIMKVNKIMGVSSFVSFDLGMLFKWLTRHWKAQTSYFSKIIFLGTMVVPIVSKNDIDSIEFLNKKFYVNLQMKYYSYVWYPGGTQNVNNKNYGIWAFQSRVNHLNSISTSKLTKLETSMILFNFMIHTKIDVRRDYGPSAAADAKGIHMNMHVF